MRVLFLILCRGMNCFKKNVSSYLFVCLCIHFHQYDLDVWSLLFWAYSNQKLSKTRTGSFRTAKFNWIQFENGVNVVCSNQDSITQFMFNGLVFQYHIKVIHKLLDRPTTKFIAFLLEKAVFGWNPVILQCESGLYFPINLIRLNKMKRQLSWKIIIGY